jgi:fucose 4-O-acetylase-like acetyltransferase
MAAERNWGIDSLKGGLMVLVILGHVIPSALDESVTRSVIYSFHMPLFLFLSGFLFPLNRILSESWTALFHRYRYRVIIPWIIAVVAYAFMNIQIYQSTQNPLIVIARHFVKPFYHLWFIPSLLFFMMLTRFLYAKVVNGRNRWWIVFGISFVFYVTAHWVNFNTLPAYWEAWDVFQNTIRMQYWVFFVLGCFLRNNPKWLSPIRGMRWYYLAYLMLAIADFYCSHVFLKLMVFFVANLLLLFQVACDVNAYKGRGWGVLNWMGNESMGIYLWHVVSILYIKNWWGTEQIVMLYVWQFSGVLLTLLILKLWTKSSFLHQYLMGVKHL